MEIKTIVRYVQIRVIGLAYRMIGLGVITYLSVFLVCSGILSYSMTMSINYGLVLSIIAIYLQIWYEILVEISILEIWELSTQFKRIRIIIRTTLLIGLLSLFFYSIFPSLLGFALLFLSSVISYSFFEMFLDRYYSVPTNEWLESGNGVEKIHGNLVANNLAHHDYYIVGVLLILQPIITLVSYELSKWTMAYGPSLGFGNILFFSIVLSIVLSISYLAKSENSDKPFKRKKRLHGVVLSYTAIQLLLMAYSKFPLISLLFFGLTYIGLLGLSLYPFLRYSLQRINQNIDDPQKPYLALSFWLVVSFIIVSTLCGVYYYIFSIAPAQWTSFPWYEASSLFSIITTDWVLSFNSYRVAFAVFGFLIPLYFSIGCIILCSDGRSSKNRIVSVILGFVLGYMIAVPSSTGITNTIETGFFMILAFVPLIVVLLSESRERFFTEIFAVSIFASALIEIASLSVGTLRSGFSTEDFTGYSVFGGSAFQSSLWINSIIILAFAALVRIWKDVNLSDDEVFYRIRPRTLGKSIMNWYANTSKKKQTLLPLGILLLIVLSAIKPSIPSLYSVDNLTSELGGLQPISIAKTGRTAYVSYPYAIRGFDFDNGLRTFPYAWHHGFGTFYGMALKHDESSQVERLSHYYLSTDEGLLSLNVTSTWDDPISVLNNTALENVTFTDIVLDSTASYIYAVASNSTLWNISTSDYSFSKVDFKVQIDVAEITRVSLRENYLCVATTLGFSVYNLDLGTWYLASEGPAIDKKINDISTDGNSIYLATDEGFMIYSLGNDTITPEKTINVPDIPSPIVDCLEYEHYLGGVLLATRGGICRYHFTSQSIDDYQETASLGASEVKDMVSIQDGPNLRVFVTADDGLFLFSINYEILRSPFYPLWQAIGANSVGIVVAIIASVTTSASLWLLKGREPSTPRDED